MEEFFLFWFWACCVFCTSTARHIQDDEEDTNTRKIEAFFMHSLSLIIIIVSIFTPHTGHTLYCPQQAQCEFARNFQLFFRTVSPLWRRGGQWHDDIAIAPVDVPRLLHQRLLEWADNLVDCRLVVNIFECLVERKGGRHFLRTECSDRLKLKKQRMTGGRAPLRNYSNCLRLSRELLHHGEGSCGQRWRTWWDSIGKIINFVSVKSEENLHNISTAQCRCGEAKLRKCRSLAMGFYSMS